MHKFVTYQIHIPSTSVQEQTPRHGPILQLTMLQQLAFHALTYIKQTLIYHGKSQKNISEVARHAG